MGEHQQKSYHVIYFLLQPFFTLLYYLKNFRRPEAKNVMWLFTVFYAATFAVGVESEGNDINHYISQVSLLYDLNLDLNGALLHFASTSQADYVSFFLAYITSLLTDNGYFLVIIFGIIYGFFFSRNMWYVLKRLNGDLKIITVVLLCCLFLIIPIWDINGFRFWTAAHVFVYGLLPFLYEGKKKSLIWCFITPFLIHFSFLVALVPIVVFLLLGTRLKFYYIFFVASMFISEVNIGPVNEFVKGYIPERMYKRATPYIREERLETYDEEDKRQNMVWYARYYKLTLKYVLMAFLIVFYWVYRNSGNNNKELFKLLGFVLLFFAFANLLTVFPSGGRFVSIASLLSLTFIILLLQNHKVHRHIYNTSQLALPFLIFFIVVSVRASLFSFSMMTLLGNPLFAIWSFGENVAINDIIKGL